MRERIEMKRRNSKRSWPNVVFIVAAFASSLLLGCSAKETPEEAPTVTVQVATASNQAIQRKISADAVLYPRDQAAIVPKVIAPVKKFYVERGSRVHAGQLLAELENQDLAGSKMKSQGGVQQAEANYQMQAQKGAQDIKLAKEQLDAQQRLYTNRQDMFKQGAISAKDVEDAGVALTQARNQYELVQKQADLKVAEAQLNAAKGDNSSAEAQLSYSKITSPIDGVVTDRPFYAGETPPVGSPIITVMDLSQIIARAHISQQEAAHLKAGDAATISGDGQGSGIPGKVTLVSPALDPNSTTVEVWVQAANSGNRLKAGASAHVSIIGEIVQHAIVIPSAALLTAPDGSVSVIVLDAQNMPHKKQVKVGIRDGDDAQITEGLQGGERVVTVGAFELDREDDAVLAKTRIQVQAAKTPGQDEEK